MVLIDSHFLYKNLYHKVDGDQDVFRNRFLQAILEAKTRYSKNYGDVILAKSSSSSWRKEYIVNYDEKDKEEIDIESFYYIYNDILNILKECTNIKIIGLQEAESVDIMHSLSTISSKNLFYTGNKSGYQFLKQGNVFDTNYRTNLDVTVKDVDKGVLKEILLGNKRKNIPNIVWNSEPSKELQNYIKDKYGITITPYIFYQMLFQNRNMLEEFLKATSLSPYKNIRFGETSVDKLIKENRVQSLLLSNPIIQKNYDQNKLLLDNQSIPKEIIDKCIAEYNDYKKKIPNMNKLYKYLDLHNLNNIKEKINDFY